MGGATSRAGWRDTSLYDLLFVAFAALEWIREAGDKQGSVRFAMVARVAGEKKRRKGDPRMVILLGVHKRRSRRVAESSRSGHQRAPPTERWA